MNGFKVAALVLIALGAVGLFFGTIRWTEDSHRAKVGSLELVVKDHKSVSIPVWAGVAAVVAGGAMLLVPRKRT